MRAGTGWVWSLLLLCLGCGVPVAANRPARPLAGALEVAVAGDTAWLTLHATNVSGAPVVLRFTSAQRYDFEVRDRTGTSVWHWSADRQFAQVVGEERLAPGATVHWRGFWLVGERRGEYVAVGRLLAVRHGLELSAGFEVGQE